MVEAGLKAELDEEDEDEDVDGDVGVDTGADTEAVSARLVVDTPIGVVTVPPGAVVEVVPVEASELCEDDLVDDDVELDPPPPLVICVMANEGLEFPESPKRTTM